MSASLRDALTIAVMLAGLAALDGAMRAATWLQHGRVKG